MIMNYKIVNALCRCGVPQNKPYYERIPRAMEEAAKLDGADLSQIFMEIEIPLSRAGLVISGFLCFARA
jgi:ABC-type glycerol-3-phosphate transport system permease component